MRQRFSNAFDAAGESRRWRDGVAVAADRIPAASKGALPVLGQKVPIFVTFTATAA
jgi:hypothetical protein